MGYACKIDVYWCSEEIIDIVVPALLYLVVGGPPADTHGGALVVDEIHLLDTELADFLLAEILALAAARTSRSAGTAFSTASSGTAFSSASTGMSTLATFAGSGWRC